MQQQQPIHKEQIPKIASVDIKQEGLVHDAQYDYYGKRLAICSSDGFIQIFDVSKNEGIYLVASFKASDKGPVWQVTWAHPQFGNIIATCSYDKKVMIWKEQKQNEWVEVMRYEHVHQGSVNSIAWAPPEYGLKLAATSSDGLCGIYSLRLSDDTWHQPYKWEAHQVGINGVTWQPSNEYGDFENDAVQNQRLATGSCDKSVIVWQLDHQNKQQKLLTLEGHTDWVRDVCWSPAVNEYQLIASCSEDKTVILWKIYDLGKENSQRVEKIVLKVDQPAWRVSWSLTGSMLAVSAASKNQEGAVIIFKENENGEWVKSSDIIDQNE